MCVIDWRDPAVRRVFKLMLPVTLGLGLINVNALVDTFFASRFINPNLAPAAIDKAFRIYMLPQGMFSVAVATVLFPTLSRHAARGDLDGFRGDGLRSGCGRSRSCSSRPASSPPSSPSRSSACSTSAARSRPTRRPSSPVRSRRSRSGSTFNGAMLMLNRSFFSLQSNWVPTAVALGTSGSTPLLDAAFYRFGIWGIPLSTSVVNIAGTVALARAAATRSRPDRVRLAIASSFVRMLVAGAALAVVA